MAARGPKMADGVCKGVHPKIFSLPSRFLIRGIVLWEKVVTENRMVMEKNVENVINYRHCQSTTWMVTNCNVPILPFSYNYYPLINASIQFSAYIASKVLLEINLFYWTTKLEKFCHYVTSVEFSKTGMRKDKSCQQSLQNKWIFFF